MWIGVVKLLKRGQFEMYRSFFDTKISSDFWDALISGFIGTNWNGNDTN